MNRAQRRSKREDKVTILPIPSPLFFKLMIHAGWIRFETQDPGPALQLNGLPQ